MNLILRTWRSTLGKKYVMALSGLVLCAFVVGHLLGNLQVFGSPDLINTYAHFLKSKPTILWAVRLGLLACVSLHIAAALTLNAANRTARPQAYAGGNAYGSTRGSRTMVMSGLIILAFVVYHLAHFTALLPGVNGVGDFRKIMTVLHGQPVPDVYGMMILGFQVWWVVVFYLVAQGLLFMHLGHGVSAMFQSLGLRDHVWWPRVQTFTRAASTAIFIGYAVIPIAIYMRMVGADYGTSVRNRLAAGAPSAAAAGWTAGAARPAPALAADSSNPAH